MGDERKSFRELFVEELAEIRGGDPEIASGVGIRDFLCSQCYTTMACGEETGPCAPTGC